MPDPKNALERVTSYGRCYSAIRSRNGSRDPAEAVDFVFSESGAFIRPSQSREEILGLLRILGEAKPRRVVEIGTAGGGTLYLFARVASEDAVIVSIDLPGGAFGGGYLPWRIPLYRSFAGPRQRLHLLRGDSHSPVTAGKLEARLKSGKIDFLFIDGDHTAGGVKKDFEMYSPLVAHGGLIGFHDIVRDPSDAANEVHRFWEEIRSRYPHREIVSDRRRKYGIGLIRYENA